MKQTAIAPSNIAFIKYWGRKDDALRLPENGSISMNLSNLSTVTSVEFSSEFIKDYIEINDVSDKNESLRVIKHLDLIRKSAGIKYKAKVISKNNFPSGTGLSSSASGFAALTLAASKAAGLNLSEKDLSILARQGSGSACRSIPDGFVEWLDGDRSNSSYSKSIYDPDYWDIRDIVVIVSTEKKDISTSEGQKLVNSSVFYEIRRLTINKKIILAKKYLKEKDFLKLGELIEAEALELHAIMLTSNPSLIYWTPGTLNIMKLVKRWRDEGVSVYFTINTGQDIHLICQEKTVPDIMEKLKKVEGVKSIIVNKPAVGTRLIT
jgi:diphosphomevalonate decarboxylase